MDTTPVCPGCGKPLERDAPKGLCPECLMKGAFPTTAGPGAARFEPPAVPEIATLFPQLEVIGLIGKGGMGAVYKARQPGLDRFVALKVLPPVMADDPGFAERFNREARALARLNHPNIVTVYDFGKAGILHYLLMEYVDGTNLREVERAGQLSPEQALAIVPQICEALQFAHNEGIVHRDIKPENLLLDKKGRLKITDFGIAKILGVPAGKTSLTGAKDVVGTPHYMAPEQIEKPQTVDHRADIYSLGVVFYEMLTGELPLGKFAPPSKKVQVDVRLDEVVLHTLEKEPERRYQQASQVKSDVETIATTAPPAIPPAGLAAGPPPAPAHPAFNSGESDKIILPAFLLSLFFGFCGAHRFYVGKIGTGILQLCTCGGFGVWSFIDLILILCKAFTDKEGRRLTRWWHSRPGQAEAGRTYRSPAPPMAGEKTPASTEPLRQALTATAPPEIERLPGPMITAPAIGLIVAGSLKLLSALNVLVLFNPATRDWISSMVPGLDVVFSSNSTTWMWFAMIIFKGIPGLLILFGGFQMLQRRSYVWSLAAGVLSIVACSLVGLPAGIWALIVLAREDVRAVFDRQRTGPTTTGQSGWSAKGSTIAFISVFLLLVVLISLGLAATSTIADRIRQPGARLDLATVGVQRQAGGFGASWKQSFPLEPGGQFGIDNVNGRIDIHGWNSNFIALDASIQGKNRDSVEAVEINVESNANRVVIHTEGPSSETGFPWSWGWFKSSRQNDATVDYTVQVPRNARLTSVSDVNGPIAIEGVRRDIAVSTVNGAMEIKDASRDLKLASVNGDITAGMTSLGRGQSVSIASVNGRIRLSLPDNADADFSVSSVNGALHSEFSQLNVKERFPIGSTLKGRLGRGRAKVKATIVNGTIDILKLPAAMEQASPSLPPAPAAPAAPRAAPAPAAPPASSVPPAQPLSVDTAAKATATNNLALTISNMMKDPQSRAMLRSQSRLMINQTYRALEIPPDQLDQLEGLLLDRQMAMVQPGLSAINMKGSVADANKADQACSKILNEYNQKIRGLLGPQEYRTFTDYERSMTERQQVQGFETTLPSKDALTGQQEEDLVAAMYQARLAIPNPNENKGSLSPADRMAVSVKYLEQVEQSYLQAAARVLTPAQLEYFKQWQAQIVGTANTTMKQMFGAP